MQEHMKTRDFVHEKPDRTHGTIFSVQNAQNSNLMKWTKRKKSMQPSAKHTSTLNAQNELSARDARSAMNYKKITASSAQGARDLES